MLKSQAVYLNQTIAKQREKLNESKLITDSLYKSNKDLDSLFFETGKLAVYYRAENERLKVENAKLAKRASGSIKTDIYMGTVWTILATFGLYTLTTR